MLDSIGCLRERRRSHWVACWRRLLLRRLLLLLKLWLAGLLELMLGSRIWGVELLWGRAMPYGLLLLLVLLLRRRRSTCCGHGLGKWR